MAKIDDLKTAATRLVRALHIPGLHWGCVNSFNHNVSLGTITTDEDEILRQISSLSAGGKTALYRSIAESIDHLCNMHYSANRKGIPMMVLTFTDGQNYGAGGKIADARNAIKRWDFFPSNNCYFAIAGVGDADEGAMRRICEDGYGMYRHCNSMDDVLGLYLFVVISIIIRFGGGSAGIDVGSLSVQQMWAFVERYAAVGPIDYVLNLDRSASMGPGSGGICFISTAASRGNGLPDDCRVLRTLRQFRDEVLISQLGLCDLVANYYAIAPDVVGAIECQPDPREWYRMIYETWLLPCTEDIEAGDNSQALAKYQAMVRALQEALGLTAS